MRAGFWQKFTVKDGDDGAGRAKGKRRDDKKRVLRLVGLKGAGGRRGMRPVVFVGGAVVRALDNQDVVGKGLPVAERRERIAVRIKQGKIKIAGTGSVDALLVLKPELNLHQHAGFLLEAVASGERDFQAVASGVAYRRFPYKLERHGRVPVAVMDFSTVQPEV
jgi:hypothetical protein